MLGGSDGGWIVHDDGGQVGGGDAGPCRVTSQPHEDDPLSGRPPDVERRSHRVDGESVENGHRAGPVDQSWLRDDPRRRPMTVLRREEGSKAEAGHHVACTSSPGRASALVGAVLERPAAAVEPFALGTAHHAAAHPSGHRARPSGGRRTGDALHPDPSIATIDCASLVQGPDARPDEGEPVPRRRQSNRSMVVDTPEIGI
jgi:hypothetical protein